MNTCDICGETTDNPTLTVAYTLPGDGGTETDTTCLCDTCDDGLYGDYEAAMAERPWDDQGDGDVAF